ncbi:MAG: hypothetical protein ABR582_04425 [Gemmatimonadaceae bacterium]
MPVRSAGLRLAGVLFIIAVSTACTENLDTSAGCPALCSNQSGDIQTVTIDPVVLDTAVSALTGQGTESEMLVATRGDTVDSRAIIRFDSIPARYQKNLTDTTTTAITIADSARIQFRIDTVNAKFPGPITIEAYDVNSDAPDSLISAVTALFTPDRLIASQTFDKDSLKDTVRLSLPPAAILSRLGGRMRVGLRATSPGGSVQFRIFAVESGLPELLYFRVDPDTSIKAIQRSPLSTTPANQTDIATHLSDYTALAKGPPPPPTGVLDVGGLPARRIYMRFNIPPFISDTAQIIRASLLMTQRPDRSVDPKDTVRIVAHVSLAAKAVTDVTRAAQITAQSSLDTTRVAPGDSGVKAVEIAQVINLWRTQKVDQTPRAVVLVSATEGSAPLRALFFSIEAAPDLRPRLRISYSTRKSSGLP